MTNCDAKLWYGYFILSDTIGIVLLILCVEIKIF